MPLRLEAAAVRAQVKRLEPILLRVRLVNDAETPWSGRQHMLSHGPYPQFVWWEARLPDGRFFTNSPMTLIACPASADHGGEMGSLTLPPRGSLDFDLVAENGLQVEPEPPDWVVAGASNAAGVVDIVVKDAMFALESAVVRVTVV